MVDKLAIQTDVSARPPLAPTPVAGKPAEHRPAGVEAVQDSRQQRTSDPQELEAAVSKINDYVQSVRRELNFSIDESVGRTVIKVMNAQDNELIRQIPPEEILDMARHLRELSSGDGTQGLLVKVDV